MGYAYRKPAWMPFGTLYYIAYCPTCASIVPRFPACCKHYFFHEHPLTFIKLSEVGGERRVEYELFELVPEALKELAERAWKLDKISAPNVEYLLHQALSARESESD